VGDVFISYSRHDKDFVVQLHDALQRTGRDIWVDWEGIPPSAEWMNEVHSAIESAEAILFVVSSHSAASHVCAQEVLHAVGHNKRLIPVVREDINPELLPQPVADRNWIFFRATDDFDHAMTLLLSAIDVDLDWTKRHTRLLTRAIEWQDHGRDPGYALYGSDLRDSERDLAAAQSKEPRLTDLQIQYILESRHHTHKRRNIAIASAAIAATVLMVVGLLLWQKRYESNLNLARNIREKGISKLVNHDPLSAEVYLARSLSIDEELETRQLLLQARATSAKLLQVVPGDAGRTLLGFSPDGKQYLVQSDANLELWEISPRQLVQSFPVGPENILAVTFSRDMQRLVVGTAASIEIWKIGLAARAPAQRIGGVTPMTSLAVSPDDTLILAGAIDGTLSLFDARAPDRPPVRIRSHQNRVSSLAFTADGQFVASGSWDNTVKVWAVTGGQDQPRSLTELRTLVGHNDAVLSVAFSADGSTIASGSWDNRIWLWDRATGQRLRQLRGHAAGIVSLAFSVDGKWLASGSEDQTARIWTVDTGRMMITLPGLQRDVKGIVFGGTPSDPQLAAGDKKGTIRLWDIGAIGQREEITTLRGHERPVNAINFNPQREQLASGGWGGRIRLWDLKTGQQRMLGAGAGDGHTDSVTVVAFSPDGEVLVSGGKDGTTRVWDTARGSSRLLEWPEESDPVIVRDLAFSPDGKLIASANDDGHVRVWDASVQRLVRDFAVTREAGAEKVLSVIFSPNGQLLASASEDGQIRLWRVSDWTPVRTLAGHTKEVWQVVFSPNGRYLLSASDDRSVRVWDVGTGRQIGLPVPHEGPVWSLDVSPDGKTLLTGSSDSTAHLWNIATAAGTIGVTHRAVLRVSEEPVWKVAFARKAGAPLLAAIAGADSEIHVLNLDHFDSFLEEPRKLEQQAMEQTGLQIADGPELSIVPEDRAAASPK